MGNFLAQIVAFWKSLTLKQQISLIALTIVTVVALVGVVTWANKPQYEILFSNLSPGDASAIVDKLKEQGISYKLTNGGSTILVPEEKVYDLRINFAGQGLPSTSVVGYELFDENKLGVSDFVQKLNYRRALEGELQKTINQMKEVVNCRVHLVIPEERLFKEDQAEPTASVVVQLKSGAALAPKQVQAIAFLIAGSVEKLSPERVTIVDTYGNVLSSGMKGDMAAVKSATQLELKQNIEQYYRQKVQHMLDAALGVGKSVVQVAIDLDFKQVDKQIESYDPESQVIRSEQRTKTENITQDSTAAKYVTSRNENNSTTYEINRTIERIVDAGGDIAKIQASVLVDGKYEKVVKEDGTVEEKFVPRSRAELRDIQKAVENAIGYDPYRGDVVTVTQIQFATPGVPQVNPPVFEKYLNNPYVKNLLVLLIAAIALFLARRTLKKTTVTFQSLLKETRRTPAGLLESSEDVGLLPAAEPEKLAEVQRKSKIQYEVKKYIMSEPKQATDLLRAWLFEE